jgi:hypothetical protein
MEAMPQTGGQVDVVVVIPGLDVAQLRLIPRRNVDESVD